MQTDVLVVGGGVSGLRAAIQASVEGAKVTLINKGSIGTGSETAYLDHLIELTVVGVSENEEDKTLYAKDLIDFGRHINDEDLVNTFVTNSLAEYEYISSLGVPMEKIDHTYPSHRAPRLIKGIGHFGQNLLSRLKNEAISKGVNIIENATLYDVKEETSFRTAYVGLKAKGIVTDLRMQFSSLILATGGGGRIFSISTNPGGSTGDGVAIALKLGANITNLEFLHFLPLLVKPIKGYYLTSAIFTKGYMKNTEGEKYIPNYPPGYQSMEDAELQGYLLLDACMWIQKQILEKRVTENNGVYWDGRHLKEDIKERIPNSYEKLKERGLDLLEDIVEVSTGCHQLLGGVEIDSAGSTNVPWLFAAGEVAGGFHGAERLMGTGVMDGLVFGARSGSSAAKNAMNTKFTPEIEREKPENFEGSLDMDIQSMKQEIQKKMDHILITKDNTRLQSTRKEVHNIYAKLANIEILSLPVAQRLMLSECMNITVLSLAYIDVSMRREETRGSFIRTDFQQKATENNPSFVRLVNQDVFEVNI
ncbi:FAD-binding protein [Geomicrobium sp. JSM 1781026]|uniref:FAD-binding protein n=1 Tax=Geomicrobium sp. JSM 1781026 TaxID=3344580 RepID=UPI0035C1887F